MSTAYSGRYRDNLDDDSDIEELERQAGRLPPKEDPVTGDPIDPNAPPADLTPEEASFKKRYGDLRRHQAKQDARIRELEAQLREAAASTNTLPATEEELADWEKRFPDLARILDARAERRARKLMEGFEARMAQLDEREALTRQERAELEIKKAHPDFDTLRNSQDLFDWLDEQPQAIRDALENNTEDARSAVRALDLYKLDRGLIGQKEQRKPKPDAAREVPTRRSAPDPEGGPKGRVWKESEIRRMKPWEYEKYEDEISAAQREGRLVYDLSAASM